MGPSPSCDRGVLAVCGLAALVVVAALAVSNMVIGHALKDRTDALEAEKAALRREQKAGYYQSIALADRESLVGNPPRVDRLLGACPAEFRNWEWHYLKRVWHSELRTLPVGAEAVCLAFNPDTGDLAVAAGARAARRSEAVESRADRENSVLCEATPTRSPPLHSARTAGVLPPLAPTELSSCGTWRRVGKSHSIPAHDGGVGGVAFSPDGSRLATAGADQVVAIWETASARKLFTLPGHGSEVWGVAFSPDGKRLATAGADQNSSSGTWPTGRRLSRSAATRAWCVGWRLAPTGADSVPPATMAAPGSGTPQVAKNSWCSAGTRSQ